MNALEKRSVAALASVYALRMLGLFMVLPVFVLLGKDLHGATPALLGVAIGAYGLSQAMLQIPFGMLSDRLGRKRLIYFGLLLFALGSCVAGASDSIYGVIVGRILQGSGAIASVLMALLSDLTREENRTKAMATVGLSIGVSFSVSLFLGPLLGSLAGLSGIFYITGLFALVAIAMVRWLVPKPALQSAHLDAQPAKAKLKQVLTDRRLLRLDFGIAALHLVLTSAFLVIPTLLQDRIGLPSGQHWWVYLSVMAVAFVAMVPFIIIGEKKRMMKPVLCGAVGVLTLACAALIGLPQSLPVMWGILFFFFMAFNLLEACLPSLISKESPAAAKGTAMGVYSTSQFLGAFLGGVLGGQLLQQFGPAGVFMMMVTVLLAWLGFALTMPRPSHTSSFVVQLAESNRKGLRDIDQALRALPGVEDVVILSDADTAYLKVDYQHFDSAQLGQFAFVKA
ncbi:MFS transporter [Marinobacter sp. BGYM27]|uniref:MFS transporter n=1 Tax=Marinobacter sp. BGYM27 TaxID=2975597 RepID=UPI0021A4F697|nr:MFS transporter [Marinobacter sp. BGYM27]MDG5500834.1 MFS transporter [Marinobacter sp. BGYM27]